MAAGAVEHLNDDHGDACLLIAQLLGGRPDATEARVTGLDRYGLDLVATGPDGPGRVRVPWDEPVGGADSIRAAAVALVRRAAPPADRRRGRLGAGPQPGGTVSGAM